MYAQQLFTKVREKRYPASDQGIMESNEDILRSDLDETVSKKGISPELLALWDEVDKEQRSQNTKEARAVPRAKDQFNDNLWSKQWYMVRHISILTACLVISIYKFCRLFELLAYAINPIFHCSMTQ